MGYPAPAYRTPAARANRNRLGSQMPGLKKSRPGSPWRDNAPKRDQDIPWMHQEPFPQTNPIIPSLRIPVVPKNVLDPLGGFVPIAIPLAQAIYPPLRAIIPLLDMLSQPSEDTWDVPAKVGWNVNRCPKGGSIDKVSATYYTNTSNPCLGGQAVSNQAPGIYAAGYWHQPVPGFPRYSHVASVWRIVAGWKAAYLPAPEPVIVPGRVPAYRPLPNFLPNPWFLPIGRPMDHPRPMPYQLLPHRRPHPGLNPEQQTQMGNAVPRTPIQIGWIPRSRVPPRPRQKERKLVVAVRSGGTRVFFGPGNWLLKLGTGLGMATEIVDAITAVHKALPKKYQAKRIGGRKPTPQAMFDALYRNADKLNVADVIANLLIESISDRARGALGRALVPANRAIGRPFGVQSGPIDSPPDVFIPDRGVSIFD